MAVTCPVTLEGEEDVIWFSDSETPALISAAAEVEVLNICFPSPDVLARLFCTGVVGFHNELAPHVILIQFDSYPRNG